MNMLDAFRDLNSDKKGWLLGLKSHYIAYDKQKHIVLGIALFIFAIINYYVFRDYTFYDSTVNAFGVTLATAVIKEVYDFILFKLGKKENYQPIPDIIATVGLPFIIVMVIRLIGIIL